MSVIGSNILAGAAGQGGGYVIDNSLRLRSSASAYLSRTPATDGDRKTWTWSGWVKRGGLSFIQDLFLAKTNTTSDFSVRFLNDDTLAVRKRTSAALEYSASTSAVFRDPSAWYHIIVVFDTTQTTSSDRIKLYVNEQSVALSGSYPSLNSIQPVNNTIEHQVGADTNASRYFDGYLAEVNFIDGQALTPSSFGDYNEDTGVWQPAKYAGSYGTNGFYLNFSDATTTSTLAEDSSGNGNNWTPNNISLTAGVTYDSMTDTPTPYADGGNYAVLNPLDKTFNTSGTFVDGNLGVTSCTSTVNASFWQTSGKWYFETVFSAISGASSLVEVGLRNKTAATGNIQGYLSSGNKDLDTAQTAYGATYTVGDVIGCAFDLDVKSITFYKNGVSQGAFTYTDGDAYTPSMIARGTTTWSGSINFGQRPFAYTPPTGFKTLHTGNLPDSAIENGSEYFAATLYSGQATDKSVTGVGFQPDLTWIKRRDGVDSHVLADSVRGSFGAGFYSLFSNLTNAESTSLQIETLDADGFTVNGDTSATNRAGQTYVAWNWKAGGAAVTNTAGSITSQVSASPTAGFSVVTYTGTGANATVGHSLGAAPKMVVVKNRSIGSGWRVHHTSLASAAYVVYFNVTNAQSLEAVAFNSTAPTSSVFSVGASGDTNGSGNLQVAYCFAEVPGYSSFGSYVGNGSSDGPFVYLGFKPRYILVKCSSSTEGGEAHWECWDTSRNPYNVSNKIQYLDLTTAESTSAVFNMDILSNGFKLRPSAFSYGNNASGQTYIYMAFAENPFKNSLAQ